jgi:hypothetical protein
LDPALVKAFIGIKRKVRSIYDANTNLERYIHEFAEEAKDRDVLIDPASQ